MSSDQGTRVLTLGFLGSSQWSRRVWHGWYGVVASIAGGPWPEGPAQKVFKPSCGLLRLVNYKGGASAKYWAAFPASKARLGKSLIDETAVRRVAARVGCSDWGRLERACAILKDGADIGCKGMARTASFSKNAASAIQCGYQVSDAVAAWITKGFASGPFTEEEVPAGAKISGIMTRQKPNGSVRIILNLSAPKGMSVNDGIDSEEFPAVMSSTGKWLAVLHRAGRGCHMCKNDWADAYKHIATRAEDVDLQWFCWLEKFFVELCLVFGAASSPGIYDLVAKVVLDLVSRTAGMRPELVCQHLDDVCAAAPKGSNMLARFDEAYQAVAAELGVRMAPRDDPEKAFGPSTRGIVFGVEYDTECWTWGIPDQKMAVMAAQIKEILNASRCKRREIQSVVGRIVHVRPLLADGRLHVDHLMRLQSLSMDGEEWVDLTPEFKRQLHFWLVMLLTCSKRCAIPAPFSLPPWAVECFTDAAGGSMEGMGHGLGAVIPDLDWWAFLPWTRDLNAGKLLCDGKKVARKLSALELIGPLLVLAAGARQVRGLELRFWVDNQGSCNIWKHGYSNACRLSTTVVKAIAEVAAGLGCRIDIQKVTRCSSAGTRMADALSKGDFRRFRSEPGIGAALRADPAGVPLALLAWVARPVVEDELGTRILRELARGGMDLIGYSQ